jgi:protein-S-isoprenylcysteine O-methyltransferase Ste14
LNDNPVCTGLNPILSFAAYLPSKAEAQGCFSLVAALNAIGFFRRRGRIFCYNSGRMNQEGVLRISKSLLPELGRRIFPYRLPIGLVLTLVALEWIQPQPFFGEGLRAIHSMALVVIFSGLGLRAWAAGCAGNHTRLGRIEVRRLATGGPFAYLRNPIYAGSMVLGAGMSLLIGDMNAVLFSAAAFAILYFSIVPAEEEYLAARFGADYRLYQKSVPRFIPRLSPWQGRTEKPFQWREVRGEFHILLILVLIYSVILLEEWLKQWTG